MDAYLFDEKTRFYLGAISFTNIRPANSTRVAPPNHPLPDGHQWQWLHGEWIETFIDGNRPVIELLSLTGAGARAWLPDEAIPRGIVTQGMQGLVSATNPGPAGIWSTPIQRPDGTIALAKTEKVLGEDTMTISFVLDMAGRWQITEEMINSKLPPELHFVFSGLVLDCQLPEA